MLDDILNRVPQKQAAYVGASAFAHKAGLHASAILKDPTTYEHIDPARGQRAHARCRTRPGSRTCAAAWPRRGSRWTKGDPALARILDGSRRARRGLFL
jgi:2-isopropylmalate synthase